MDGQVLSEGKGYRIIAVGHAYGNRSAEWHFNLRAGDMARGYYYQFPPCCIAFFVGRWHRWWTNGRADLIRKHNARSNEVGYVQCPKCQRKGKCGRVPH